MNMQEKRGQQILFPESFNLVGDVFDRRNPRQVNFKDLQARQYRVVIVEGEEIVGRLGVLHKNELVSAIEASNNQNGQEQHVYLEPYTPNNNSNIFQDKETRYSQR